MPSSRRAFLAGSVGSFATLAGCVSGSDSPGDSATGTTTEWFDRSTATTDPEAMAFGETFDGDGVTITPREVTVQDSFLHIYQTDWAAAKSKQGRQFVFVDVHTTAGTDGATPGASDFVLHVDGSGHRGWTSFNHRSPDWIEGFGFDVPAPVEAEVAHLQYAPENATESTRSWTLPAETLDALRADPPSFELRDFHAPETVPVGGEIAISITVENTGGDGTFRASLNEGTDAYTSHLIRLDVPGGESRRVERRFDAPLNEGYHYFYDLQSVAGDREAEVVSEPSRE